MKQRGVESILLILLAQFVSGFGFAPHTDSDSVTIEYRRTIELFFDLLLCELKDRLDRLPLLLFGCVALELQECSRKFVSIVLFCRIPAATYREFG